MPLLLRNNTYLRDLFDVLNTLQTSLQFTERRLGSGTSVETGHGSDGTAHTERRRKGRPGSCTEVHHQYRSSWSRIEMVSPVHSAHHGRGRSTASVRTNRPAEPARDTPGALLSTLSHVISHVAAVRNRLICTSRFHLGSNTLTDVCGTD